MNDGFTRFRRDSLLIPRLIPQVREKVRRGEYSRIVPRLLSEAESLLSCRPGSLLDKPIVPPSGDKRDYISLSIYYWPHPDTPDGLPYVYRDGHINPECERYDRRAFMEMIHRVEVLSWAYLLREDERFARKAGDLLRTWFLDDVTGMHPRMLFAQYIPGENVPVLWPDYPPRYVPGTEGRQGAYVSFGGVIEDLHLVPLTDSLRLLNASPNWSEADRQGMRSWYRQYTEWLLTHPHGLDEAACRNNHGSWYWADIASFLAFTGERARACELLAPVFPQRLDMQLDPDGSQPEELVRAVSMNYTSFGLCSLTNIAIAGAEAGYDAWEVVTPAGCSLRKAVDWFIPYLTRAKPWTWPQYKPFDDWGVVGSLAACAERYPASGYDAVLRQLGLVPADHPIRLFYDMG